MKYTIFGIWLLLVIVWNYSFPTAIPFDDVFVTVSLYLLFKTLEKHFITPQ